MLKKIVLLNMIIIVLLLTSCQKQEETITIGFAGTLTGTYASVGTMELYAVQMAIAEINESGGINGRQIELIIKDDQADPEKAVEVGNDLINQGVHFIIGHTLSIVAVEVMDNAEGKDVLFLSPSIGTDSLSNIDDNLIRNVSTTLYEGLDMTEKIVEASFSKVLLVYNLDNYILTQHHKDSFEAVLSNAGYTDDDYDMIGYYRDNANDSQLILDALDTGDYDTVMLVGSNTTIAPFVNYIIANDYPIDMHLSSWASTGLIPLIDTSNTSGIYAYFDYYENMDDPNFELFHDTFFDLYGVEVDMVATNAYDLVYMLKEAIEYADSFDTELVKQAILEIGTFEGISAPYTINEYGDCLKEHLQMIIKDGEYVLND